MSPESIPPPAALRSSSRRGLTPLGLYLGKEAAEVVGYIPARQPEREKRRKQPSPDATQMAHREDLDAAAPSVERRRMKLPGAPRLEDVRLDHATLDRAPLGPVIAKTLPDEPDRPRVALGHIRPRLTRVMDFQVLHVDVAPKDRSPSREVSGSRQDTIRGGRALGDHMNLGQAATLTARSHAQELAWASVRECPLNESFTREKTSADCPDGNLVFVYRLAG
jgi:hypothetical protein